MNRSILLVIDNTIRLINASAPPSAEIALKTFRLSDTFHRISLYIADDGIEPFQCLSILHLPIQIFFSCTILPKQPH